ncbi:MAG: glycosyltransferase [Desulfobacteraceae bacterium]|nr:glycosyltransferase [Desulfobacteraceae bacterium]
MKVLHIIDSGGMYGAEVMLLNLVEQLIKRGIDSEIASIGEIGLEEKAIEKHAIKRGILVQKFRMRPGPNFYGALEILRYARKKQISILHSHGYKGNILFGLLPLKIRRLPMVSTLHGWTCVAGFTKLKAYEFLDRISLRFIERVVLVNRAMMDHPALKRIPAIKLNVVNNGICPVVKRIESDINPEIKKNCNKEFVIGSLGRLSSEKGFIYLLYALKLLIDRGKKVRLVILGEGGQRSYLEEKIRQLGLSDCVLMPGFEENASDALPYFKALIMPSLTEGLPITILEAMRAQIPIVASHVGGIPYVLKNNYSAMLVPARDPLSLADAIAQLYDFPEKGFELAKTANRIFRQNYTSEQMADSYYQIYKGLGSSAD